MTNEEIKEIIDSLYPIGRDRWFKIRILDQEKCSNALRLSYNEKTDINQGYSVREISLQGKNPDIRELQDVRDTFVEAFDEIIKKLKQHADQTETQSLED